MGILNAITAAWSAFRWLCRQRKQMEADAEAYFTEERAKEWRLEMEKVFYSVAKGNGYLANIKGMPKIVIWFFKHTKADNRIGQFGLHLMKSEKLKTNDAALRQPLKW